MKCFLKRYISVLLTLVSILCLAGCGKEEKVKKVKDIDFTVLQESEIPEKLKEYIDTKKENPFKATYTLEGYLYIVQGYGAKTTGGYSISVNDLFLADNGIYVKFSLLGPKEGDTVTEAITYPYIVVKIENLDKEVVFK